MTRFLLGLVVGVVGLAFIQVMFAPLPTSSEAGGGIFNPSRTSANGEPASPANRDLATIASSSDAAETQSGAGTVMDRSAVTEANNGGGEGEGDADADAGGNHPVSPIELPPTHAGFVDNSRPALPDEHAALEQEEVDAGWAEQVEGLIYSYISTHPQGAAIAVVSLVCRTSRCEIAGTVYGEHGGDIWQEVLGDMREQTWFAANFSDSMSGAGGGLPGEHRFITMLARIGTEIAPPVQP